MTHVEKKQRTGGSANPPTPRNSIGHSEIYDDETAEELSARFHTMTPAEIVAAVERYVNKVTDPNSGFSENVRWEPAVSQPIQVINMDGNRNGWSCATQVIGEYGPKEPRPSSTVTDEEVEAMKARQNRDYLSGGETTESDVEPEVEAETKTDEMREPKNPLKLLSKQAVGNGPATGPQPVSEFATIVRDLPICQGKRECPYCQKYYASNGMGQHLTDKHGEIRRKVKRLKSVTSYEQYEKVVTTWKETGGFGEFCISTEGFKFLRSLYGKRVERDTETAELTRLATEDKKLPLWCLSIKGKDVKLAAILKENEEIAAVHRKKRGENPHSNKVTKQTSPNISKKGNWMEVWDSGKSDTYNETKNKVDKYIRKIQRERYIENLEENRLGAQAQRDKEDAPIGSSDSVNHKWTSMLPGNKLDPSVAVGVALIAFINLQQENANGCEKEPPPPHE